MPNGRQINVERQRPSPIRPVYQYGMREAVIPGQLGRDGSQSACWGTAERQGGRGRSWDGDHIIGHAIAGDPVKDGEIWPEKLGEVHMKILTVRFF